MTPGSLPRRQSSGTGHSASCGYGYPPRPTGSGTRGNSLPPVGTVLGLQKTPAGPSMSCLVVLPSLPDGGQYSGKIRFIKPQGGKWAQEIYARCRQQRYAMGEPTNFRDGTVLGLYKSPVGTGSAVSVIGENRFIEKPAVQDEGSHHVAKRRSE